MFNEITKEAYWHDSKLVFKTGKIARQSDGSVLVRMGDTLVLCTLVFDKKPLENANFVPLSVHYKEMYYAAGKIPGGYTKRESRASDREVLVSRLIDRSLRPMFYSNFHYETQIICTVLSYDPKYNPDVISIIGASAALAISGIPIKDIVAAIRVGYLDGKFVINPSDRNLRDSDTDIIVSGSKTSVVMVEAGASELIEQDMIRGIKLGFESYRPVIDLIEALQKEVGKPQIQISDEQHLRCSIYQEFKLILHNAFTVKNKEHRGVILANIKNLAIQRFQNHHHSLIDYEFEHAISKVIRSLILKDKKRIDGRDLIEIRDIDCEIGLLPRAHGSSLFTRGQTQSVATVTLGSSDDEQTVEGLHGDTKERFMLQYIFSPYAVGEVFKPKAPSRREIGHGKLAFRSLLPVIPTKQDFPYSIRIVSEITESNGSSSMATVCAGSLALMNAGVKLRAHVAGIAMGLIKDNDRYAVLTDISEDEDHLGDMDFKVAGTRSGITSLQMDIKTDGIDIEIIQSALLDARDARMRILAIMDQCIKISEVSVSPYVPVTKTMKISRDNIREVIGSGGKVIREICHATGTKIDISDNGIVKIIGTGNQGIADAMSRINAIVEVSKQPELTNSKPQLLPNNFEDSQIGTVHDAVVTKIIDSGVFISYESNQEGFVHISEIAHTRVINICDFTHIGNQIKVKIIGFDRNKPKFSIKAVNSNVIPSQNHDWYKKNSSLKPLIVEKKYFN